MINAGNALPSPTTIDQPEYEEQHKRSYRRWDNRGDQAAAQVNVQMRQKPSAYQSTNNSNRNVGDQPKSSTLNNLDRKPTRDQSNKQNDN